MAIIIRRSKPITIKRRPRTSQERIGSGWPGEPGWPLNYQNSYYHKIHVAERRQDFVFLWVPGAPLDCMWSAGLWQCTPGVMARHDYLGVCSVIHRVDPTPQDNMVFRRRR